MCRMMGIVGGSRVNNRDLLLKFRELAIHGMRSPHKDGWGILCYKNGFAQYLSRCIEPANDSDEYKSASERLADSEAIVLAHLRKASPGKEVSLENTQPLIFGNWAFAHNGTIWSPRFSRLHQSDSIILFEELVNVITRDTGSISLEDSVAQGVKQLREEILGDPDQHGETHSSLTFMISDGNTLCALRDFNQPRDSEYYTMHYLVLPDSIVFCQEKVIEGPWKSLDNRELAIADRNGHVRTSRT